MIKRYILIFIAPYVQIMFVAINTILMVEHMVTLVFINTFLLNLIWTYNVKRVAFGNMTVNITYALGASCGSITGMYIAKLIKEIFA